MPSIFALPYVELEPELAFVLDDGDRAVGYVLGCADTPSFVQRFRSEWLPGLLSRYPVPTRAPETPAEVMVGLMHNPERIVLPEVADYPAHLHIDLLPAYQRAGHGRALMTRLHSALTSAGVPAVHLCMLTSNTPARAFYNNLAFHEIPVANAVDVTYLGRSTTSRQGVVGS